jgi:hypothetical protein
MPARPRRGAAADRQPWRAPAVHRAKETLAMTDDKKKGDFNKGGKDDVGGNKKQRADRNEASRTGNQNSGGGGRD